MSHVITNHKAWSSSSRHAARSPAIEDPALIRYGAIGLAVTFLLLVLVVPLVTVFASAFSQGLAKYWDALTEPYAAHAIGLTLFVAAITVPLNVVFGVAAAWLLAKYRFPGRSLLVTLVDLPFSISPVVSGLSLVLVFGAHGFLGPYLLAAGYPVIFALPGIVLATTFVTLPLVAREVLGVMEARGNDEEEAALVLGASGWQILWRVTLPRVRWGLLYGVILCNARAMGEFGAVSVVSGHIRGATNTMPLHVEILYNEYNFVASFAVASVLAALALVTLGVKKLAEQDWTWIGESRFVLSVQRLLSREDAELAPARTPIPAE
jgi:sulfate transport system permease protein